MNSPESSSKNLSQQGGEPDILKQKLKQKNLEFQIINDVVHEISQELELKKILDLVAIKAQQLIEADSLLIPIINKELTEYTYMAAVGKNADDVLNQTFPKNIGMCGWVLSNEESLFFGYGSSQLMGKSVDWEDGMESALLVPLRSRGTIVGGLSGLGKKGGKSFTQQDMDILQLFASHISIAIENALIFSELRLEKERAENSQKQLQAILDNTPAVVYVKDVDGKYLLINRQFEKLFDITNEKIRGLDDYALFPDDIANRLLENDQRVISGKKHLEIDEEIPQQDGMHNYISVKFPLIDLHGEVIAVGGISTDMTEHRKTEEALRRSQKMEAVGQLTGGIAHDFNNILSIILGNIELLKIDVSATEKVLKRIDAIDKAGQRAANLTKQLLSFSRGQASESVITDINKLIAGMDNLIARSITPEIDVEYQLVDELWLVNINSGDFEDTLLNLIINARDAMDGHGDLTIETRKSVLDEAYCKLNPEIIPGEYVELVVTDNGEGIPSKEQEKIFEPFFTTKDHGKGTGLGLAMVFGFVKRSKGVIKCYSEMGIGTTFRIFLPRAEGGAGLDSDISVVDEPLPSGKETILVVDDEPELLELAKQSLAAIGYQIITATDGVDALDKLAENPEIDMLFSDVVMPGGINGFELADQALEQQDQLKVLLTSGYTGKSTAKSGHTSLHANLLSKPYSQIELAKRIRSILDGLE